MPINAKGGGVALLHGRKLRLSSTARTAHNLTRAAAHLTTAISLTVDCIPCTHLTGDAAGVEVILVLALMSEWEAYAEFVRTGVLNQY